MSISASDIAKSLLEVLKLAPRYLIALGAMSAFMLFSDEQPLKFIGVFQFAQDNRPALGLTLVATTALFVVAVASDAITFLKQWWGRRRRYRRIEERLQCLTEDEKQILRYYLAENTRANTLRIDDGVVQGLKAAGIIHLSASMGNALEGFAHNINEFAWDYLHVHQHLLDGTTNTYRTDKRPDYW